MWRSTDRFRNRHAADGAILMTFENGIRFLTDHLEGDHYFHIHREGHNLDTMQDPAYSCKRHAGKTAADE